MEVRLESDQLGEVAVPADALFGARTVRVLETTSFSGRTLQDYPAFLAALLAVKRAAARANATAGVIDGRVAAAIEAACDEIESGRHLDQFPVDPLGGGGGIGVNMNVNEVLANLASEGLGGTRGAYEPVHPKRDVNASQSTADVCHTAARLAVLDSWTSLSHTLTLTIETLRRKAEELAPLETLSRTCLQDALPVSLGAKFGSYAAAIERRRREANESVERLLAVNLGGTVIGSGEGASAAYRANVLTELRAISGTDLRLREDLYDAAQNIDDVVAASSQLALLAEVLMKVAQDLRLLSSGPQAGFAEIHLPVTQEGSSFFSGKINPIVPETLLQCCFQVLGCDRVAHLALERGELDLNVFEGAAVFNVLDAITMLDRALHSFTTRCLAGLRADEERCRALIAGTKVGAA